jgi:hypothetical protein
MPNSSIQLINHFHNRTTIDDSAPTFAMLQQTTVSMFRQGYMQTASNFPMPNFSSTPYTHGGHDRTYVNASSNYQVLYSIVAYTDPISLPGSSMGFLHNHAYHNAEWFNAYGPLEASGFGYETLL